MSKVSFCSLKNNCSFHPYIRQCISGVLENIGNPKGQLNMRVNSYRMLACLAFGGHVWFSRTIS